jgi:hypothetical protein
MDGSLVSTAVPDTGGSSVAAVGDDAGSRDSLALYQRALPPEFFLELFRKEELVENNRVYTAAVVMWLMIAQRSPGKGSMQAAVLELLRGLPASFWPQPCKRLQDWQLDGGRKVSSHTGAYNTARQELPMSVVKQSCDRIFEQLIAQANPGALKGGLRIFFFDGTSVRTARSPALYRKYPPGSNQHGESHWPLIRMLVAHDLNTGLAIRPEWGPLNGPEAVSEQELLERAIDRLPPGAVVGGDGNFGVFSVAYAADRRKHPVLLRLTPVRAKALAKEALSDGIDRRIQWRPSPDDRKRHPELPPEACVRGRLIVCQVQPSNGDEAFLLCLFTTLEGEPDQMVNLYGKRWNVETDLRTLKGTLAMEDLVCKTPDMVAKEIYLAIAAYNLVRAVTCLAAQKADLPPRRYSFTRVRNVIDAFAPLIAAAGTESEAQKQFDNMMYYVGQATLPKRKKPRPSYPRGIWARFQPFPKRKV